MNLHGEVLLRVEEVTKIYGSFPALQDVSMEVRAGTLVAVMGENGAGKSTLMKIIAGIEPATKGTVFGRADGAAELTSMKERDLEKLVAIVPQEIELAEDRTVSHNIMMGIEPGHRWFPSVKAMNQKAKEHLDLIGSAIPPTMKASELDAVSKQLVLIARAIARNAQVIVFDEPTANLSPLESRKLFEVITMLKRKGKALVYVSHRIPEVMELSERIEVLRDGIHVNGMNTHETTEQAVVNSMVGREVSLTQRLDSWVPVGASVLSVDGLEGQGVGPVSLSLEAGQILGIAGLPDSGRADLLELIYGSKKPSAGQVRLHGRTVPTGTVLGSMNTGIGYLPGERRAAGIFPALSVKENISSLVVRKHTRFGLKKQRELDKEAITYAQKVGVKAANLDLPITSLSGGNQQKALIARILASAPQVLLLDEPTRGVDVGAKAEIYQLLGELTAAGMPIIMSSSDLPELLCQCHQIAVMFRGQVVALLDAARTSEEEIMAYATLGKGKEKVA